jgi:carbamate kinase
MSKKLAVVAIGGNSLIKDGKHQTVEDQYQAAKETTLHIADMIEAGWDVAIGHGNGPQVGFILRRSEIAPRPRACTVLMAVKAVVHRLALRKTQNNCTGAA